MAHKGRQYTLVVPFTIMLGDKLNKVDRDGIEFNLPNGRIIKIRNFDHYCDISMNCFESVLEAEQNISSVLLYIYWISLTTNFKVSISKNIQQPYYPECPEKSYENIFKKGGGRIDALVCNLEPYIVKSGSKVAMMYGNTLNATVGHGTEKIANTLNELNLGETEPLICSDEKLMLALELYNNLNEEKTLASKFLLMNCVAESLLKPKRKPEQLQELLDNFDDQIDKVIESEKSDSESVRRLEGLKQALKFMRKESIRNSLANLTEQAFDILGRSDGAHYGVRCKKAYDVRSELVHNGAVGQDKLQAAYQDLKEVIESILRAKILHYSKFS